MSTPSKAAWRARLRAQRQDMHDDVANLHPATSPAVRTGKDLARTGLDLLASIPAGSAVCAFISMPGEPPTAQLLESLMAEGYSVYVPVCEPDFGLSWTVWYPGVPMVRSALAPVMEPVGPRLNFEQLETVKAVLVPALAVDLSGVRLGQGGGYYDRFLPTTTHVPLAAVVYDHEVFSIGQLPHSELDAPVHYALTPTDYKILGAGSAPIL